MAFCRACGADVGAANFCPKCGANQGAAVPAASAPVTAGSSSGAADYPTAGIDENIAGLLCYLFQWVSGLVFLLIDKRPFVRFHGAQSIAFNVSCAILGIVVSIALGILGWFALQINLPFLSLLAFPLWGLFGFGLFATWIFLMYKAYQGEKWKLPIVGDFVEKMINK